MLGFSPLADNSIAGFETLNIAVTGIAATGAVGSVGVKAEVQVTGLAGTSAVGTVTLIQKHNISVTGVSATGQVGQTFQWDQIIPSQTPSWTNIAA
tara:strand:- start:473 stop:760 length:288 start_codon:yes stop_codon:yes gene_type:complete